MLLQTKRAVVIVEVTGVDKTYALLYTVDSNLCIVPSLPPRSNQPSLSLI
jgi:hypothetical protein